MTTEPLYDIPGRLKNSFAKIAYGVFTFLCVNTGWVLFRADSISQAGNYLKAMIGLNGNGLLDNLATQYFCENWIFFIVGILYSVRLFKYMRERIEDNRKLVGKIEWLGMFVYLSLFVLSVSYLVMGAYNPFIYFNF